MTKMIIGLGNPGKKYEKTRHNVGFMVVERFAQNQGVSFNSNATFKADIASIFLDGEKIYLVKPTTFMNASGLAVRALLAYYGLSLADAIIIYDDLDMAVGKLRLREKGSAGGHNGIKSIIAETGQTDFLRLKIGIGRPQHGKVVDHVLGNFSSDEAISMDLAIDKTQSLLQAWLHELPFKKLQEELNRL